MVLGRASFTLAAGASQKVVIALTRSGTAFLRQHPGIRAKIAVAVASPGAAEASRTRAARLRLPATHGHR